MRKQVLRGVIAGVEGLSTWSTWSAVGKALADLPGVPPPKEALGRRSSRIGIKAVPCAGELTRAVSVLVWQRGCVRKMSEARPTDVSDALVAPIQKQKPTTKAERRALQEAQRAAKAEKQAATGGGKAA